VSCGWNRSLTTCFEPLGRFRADHVLVVGNDTILSPTCYEDLLSYGEAFVTGVAVEHMEQLTRGAQMPLEEHPDFSCFLIHRTAWEKIGPFDERMKHYCSDCDYHIRGHQAGIRMVKACVPFYHERSSTMRLAPPEEQQELHEQASRDRAMFKKLYGCLPGEPAYEALFK
jgi:hypothetical protein